MQIFIDENITDFNSGPKMKEKAQHMSHHLESGLAEN